MIFREKRPWLLVASQMGYHIEFREVLTILSDQYRHQLLLLDRCDAFDISLRCRGGDVYEYPKILQVCWCRMVSFSSHIHSS